MSPMLNLCFFFFCVDAQEFQSTLFPTLWIIKKNTLLIDLTGYIKRFIDMILLYTFRKS